MTRQQGRSGPSVGSAAGTYNRRDHQEWYVKPDVVYGVTRLSYDRLGRQTQTTDPTDRRSTTTYNALANITAAADYGTGQNVLRTAKAEFDADGNQTAIISGTQARSTYTYDALGHMTKQVEPVTDAKSITTTFGYDSAGNRTRLTDGRGNTTTYTFTPWNLPESTIEPSTTAHPALTDRTWTTVYDKAGQNVAELLPGGVERHRTFDGLGRLVRETGTGAEATTTDRTLTYDLAGRITAAGTDGALTRNTYTYNDRVMAAPRKYPDELRERATRPAVEARKDPVGRAGAIKRIGDQLDMHPEALRGLGKRAETDEGIVPGTTTGLGLDRGGRGPCPQAGTQPPDAQTRLGPKERGWEVR